MSGINLNVAPHNLYPSVTEFWGWKEGGKVKSVKKRWFVLVPQKLYYFASPTAPSAKGCIDINANTIITEREDLHVSQEKYYVAIDSNNTKNSRCFLIYVNSDNTLQNTILSPLRKMQESLQPKVKKSELGGKPVVPNLSAITTDSLIQSQTKMSAWKQGRPSYDKTKQSLMSPRKFSPRTPNSPHSPNAPTSPRSNYNSIIIIEEKNTFKPAENYKELKIKVQEFCSEFDWFEDVESYFNEWLNTMLKGSSRLRRSLEAFVWDNGKRIRFVITGVISDIIVNALEYCYAEGMNQSEIDILDECSTSNASEKASVWIDLSDNCACDWGWNVSHTDYTLIRRVLLNKKEECNTVMNWLQMLNAKYVSIGMNSNEDSLFSSLTVDVQESNRKYIHELFTSYNETVPIVFVDSIIQHDGSCTAEVVLSTKKALELLIGLNNPNQSIVDVLCNFVKPGKQYLHLFNNLQTKFGKIDSIRYGLLKKNCGRDLYVEGSTLSFGFLLAKY
ncbi:PH domain-containing protein [Entamoeba marina]